MTFSLPIALTIAGSDPSGGAGIQADLKTFQTHGVYGASVLTLLTVQNTTSLSNIQLIDPEFLSGQIQSVLEDLPVAAVKTGALGGIQQATVISQCMTQYKIPLVVDPVMISSHGAKLFDDGAKEFLLTELLPQATLVTPNIDEAESLVEMKIVTLEDQVEATRQLAKKTTTNVLVKGGHQAGDTCTDVLLLQKTTDHEVWSLSSERIHTKHTHGTGCSLSAAITAQLAHGRSLFDAVCLSKTWIQRAIEQAPHLGKGCGPVDHTASVPTTSNISIKKIQ